ncbi:MAG: hypothetical protein PVJ67_02520 [Candidatus Pacearchaeota archaeon]|jgi:hypothetical protein
MDKETNYAGKVIDGKYILANAQLDSLGKDERLFCFCSPDVDRVYGLAKVSLKKGSSKWNNIVEGLPREKALVFYKSLSKNPHLLEELVSSNCEEQKVIPSMSDIKPILCLLTVNYSEKTGTPANASAEVLDAIMGYGRCEDSLISSRKGLMNLVKELVYNYDGFPFQEGNGNVSIGFSNEDRMTISKYLVEYIMASREGNSLPKDYMEGLVENLSPGFSNDETEEWEDEEDELRMQVSFVKD